MQYCLDCKHTVGRFGEYVLEQSVSNKAVPELMAGLAEGFFPVLHTSGQIMLKCKSKQNLIKNVSEYDNEIPQSHNAVQPTAPWGRVTEHLQ